MSELWGLDISVAHWFSSECSTMLDLCLSGAISGSCFVCSWLKGRSWTGKIMLSPVNRSSSKRLHSPEINPRSWLLQLRGGERRLTRARTRLHSLKPVLRFFIRSVPQETLKDVLHPLTPNRTTGTARVPYHSSITSPIHGATATMTSGNGCHLKWPLDVSQLVAFIAVCLIIEYVYLYLCDFI